VVSTGSLPSLAALDHTLGSPWPPGGWLSEPSQWNPNPPFMEFLQLSPFALVVVLEPAWVTTAGSHVVVQLVPQD
jgi:hypothetical protein